MPLVEQLRRRGYTALHSFGQLVDDLAKALDEAAEGLRKALGGRQQKVLANRVTGASASLVSRWLSGARQLTERNRLPGYEVMVEIVAALDLPTGQANQLVTLGERIDILREQLEQAERGWRAKAGEHYAASRAANGQAGLSSRAADEQAHAPREAADEQADGPQESAEEAREAWRAVPVWARITGRWKVLLVVAVLGCVVLAGAALFAGHLSTGTSASPSGGEVCRGNYQPVSRAGVGIRPCLELNEGKARISVYIKALQRSGTSGTVTAYVWLGRLETKEKYRESLRTCPVSLADDKQVTTCVHVFTPPQPGSYYTAASAQIGTDPLPPEWSPRHTGIQSPWLRWNP
ncbi:hypothetical protein [Nonomuraea sp. NPDC049400]|uniref:hypothetical protein n=1 Tax=Nonomuraea sp. NPDC049400 TaxID=3364352 RepID=UPI0037A213BF